MIRSTELFGIVFSALAFSCTDSPRFFDDAGTPDAGAESMPGWRLAWAVRAGGDEHGEESSSMIREIGQSVVALDGGSSYLVGQVAESAVFGPDEPNETQFADEYAGWSDGFVARYNPDGLLEWVRRVGGSDEDHVFDAVALGDGSVAVTGFFRSEMMVLGEGEPNETLLITEYGTTTGFVAKFEPDGALAWAMKIHKAEDALVWATTVDALPDDRILVGGSLRGTAWPGEPFEIVSETSDSASEWDPYLAWFDAQGEAVAAVRIGGDEQNWMHSVVALEDGSIVAAMTYGFTELFGKGEPNETTLSCPLQQDANDCSSLARYDAEGRLVWVRDLGVTKATNWYAQAVAGGSVAIVGYFHAITNPELGETDFALGDDEFGVLVAQYDVDDGDLDWARIAKAGAGWAPSQWRGITALPEGGFLADFVFQPTLSFEGDDPGQRVLTAEGETGIALVRFSATGEILWMHGMGNEGKDYGSKDFVSGGSQLNGQSYWLTGAYGSDPFVATSGHGDDVELPLTDSIWKRTEDVFLMRFDAVSPPTE